MQLNFSQKVSYEILATDYTFLKEKEINSFY